MCNILYLTPSYKPSELSPKTPDYGTEPVMGWRLMWLQRSTHKLTGLWHIEWSSTLLESKCECGFTCFSTCGIYNWWHMPIVRSNMNDRACIHSLLNVNFGSYFGSYPALLRTINWGKIEPHAYGFKAQYTQLLDMYIPPHSDTQYHRQHLQQSYPDLKLHTLTYPREAAKKAGWLNTPCYNSKCTVYNRKITNNICV